MERIPANRCLSAQWALQIEIHDHLSLFNVLWGLNRLHRSSPLCCVAASTQQLWGVYKQTAVSCSHSSHALKWMWSLSTEGISPQNVASVWDKLACHSLRTLGWHNPCIAAINIHEMDCHERNYIRVTQIWKCHQCHLCVGLSDVPFSYGVTFFF